MPRKPTQLARRAREALLRTAQDLSENEPFPSLAELGQRYGLNASTIFRILKDLAAEGIVWQSPSGRFYAAWARRARLRAKPLCFIGRELWIWSRLYQELLNGVSEVCATNASPLVALTSRDLVRQASPLDAPQFASVRQQVRELGCLLPNVPQGCAGLILDHAWSPEALQSVSWPGGERVQLLCGVGQKARVVGPDFAQGAKLTAGFAANFQHVVLVRPFAGDPTIDTAWSELLNAFALRGFETLDFSKETAPTQNFPEGTLLICPEDNIAAALAAQKPQGVRAVFGFQGTGALRAPHPRLRFDYRRIGRAAASLILHGTPPPAFRAQLIGAEFCTIARTASDTRNPAKK